MSVRGVAEIAADRSALRNALAALQFSDDGETLRGPVLWAPTPGDTAVATVAISFPAHFPFGPPAVRILDPGHPLDVTFHIERTGLLCLWDMTEPAGEPPWLDAGGLVDRIAGWLELTAVGWPGDEDCDLERYVKAGAEGDIILYNSDHITPVDVSAAWSTVMLHRSTTSGTIFEVGEARRPPGPRRWKPTGRKGESRKTGLPDNAQGLVYVADIGPVVKPIAVWDDFEAVLGKHGRWVRDLILQGSVESLILLYKRGAKQGTLGLAVTADAKDEITITSREVADTCIAARSLRAGPQADLLAAKKVAVVGCGAVGSFVADMLYRQGVRHLTLIDQQRYRPGNAVRHAAPSRFAGMYKTDAVVETLRRHQFDMEHVTPRTTLITDPEEARGLYRDHDLVIDATADNRTTNLLMWASDVVGKEMVTVCVQRDGGIARADRFPLQADEQHLPPVPELPEAPAPLVERGCGDSVSPTPPGAVVAAAELGVEMAVDRLCGSELTPATLLRVLAPQPDEPYTTYATLVPTTIGQAATVDA